MTAIGVIPARYGSTRLEAKMLRELCGKPMIQHVYERAKKARALDDLVVATDDRRIQKAVELFGGKAVMTSSSHATGTDRLAEVVNHLDVKIVVNIQGDEPLIHASVVDDLVHEMQADPQLAMATAVSPPSSPTSGPRARCWRRSASSSRRARTSRRSTPAAGRCRPARRTAA